MNLHIERRGEGPPLVVLPSFSLNHHAMSRAVEPVFSDKRVEHRERRYVDLPGTGQSPASQPDSDDVLDRTLATLSTQLDDRRFAVLGWSYGPT